jgi:4-methyl-5(b-hydroxyethyl)-thiazole monophosphate biosynthesis
MASVLIPIADGSEELEAVTLIDLLRRAGIEVVVAGLQAGPVTCSRGTVLLPDSVLDDVLGRDFDMVVLPGGLPGADHLDQDPRIHALLKRMAEDGNYTAAICAAPKVLANAGLLSGRRATSYPGVIDSMALADTEVVAEPVVLDGNIITSRGPGTAMDFALALIEQLAGAEQRQAVETPLMRP